VVQGESATEPRGHHHHHHHVHHHHHHHHQPRGQDALHSDVDWNFAKFLVDAQVAGGLASD
jgi:glutathione peroxidase-family protein